MWQINFLDHFMIEFAPDKTENPTNFHAALGLCLQKHLSLPPGFPGEVGAHDYSTWGPK
jgi:hypothetical protein